MISGILSNEILICISVFKEDFTCGITTLWVKNSNEK